MTRLPPAQRGPVRALPQALQQSARSRVLESVDEILARLDPHLETVIKNNPSKTATEILARQDVSRSILYAVATAQKSAEATLTAAHGAARVMGERQAAQELSSLGLPPLKLEFPGEKGTESGEYLAALVADMSRAFEDVRAGIATAVTDAYAAAISLPPDTENIPLATAQHRAALAGHNLNKAVSKLRARTRASCAVAVTRGQAEAKVGVYQALQAAHPGIRLAKRWRTTSAIPCPSCKALDGTYLPMGAEFPPEITASESFTPPRVYRDLLVPPRHPECKCVIELVVDPQESKLAREMTKKLVPYPALSAATVRSWSEKKYRSVLSTIQALLRLIGAVLGKRSGDHSGK